MKISRQCYVHFPHSVVSSLNEEFISWRKFLHWPDVVMAMMVNFLVVMTAICFAVEPSWISDCTHLMQGQQCVEFVPPCCCCSLIQFGSLFGLDVILRNETSIFYIVTFGRFCWVGVDDVECGITIMEFDICIFYNASFVSLAEISVEQLSFPN